MCAPPAATMPHCSLRGGPRSSAGPTTCCSIGSSVNVTRTRIQHLESQILAAKKTPDELAKLVKQIETTSRAKLADLRAALAAQTDRREAFLALFPDGLVFAPARTPDGKRQIWRITGDTDLGSLVDPSGLKRIKTRPPANDRNDVEEIGAKSSKEGDGPIMIVTPRWHHLNWTRKRLVDTLVAPPDRAAR